MSKKIVYLMAFLMLLGVAGSAWADALVAHWELREGSGTTAYDSTANDNDGTLTNMDTGVCWGLQDCPELGGTLTFDDLDDYVRVEDDATLNFGDGPFSIAFWMNATGGGKVLIKGSSDPPLSGKRYVIYVSGSLFCFDIDDVATKSNIAKSGFVYNEWHHYVCRRIADGGMDVYRDGVQWAAEPGASATGNIDAPDEPLLIGRSSLESSGDYLGGQLSDIRIYDYALSPEEITALLEYQSTVPWCPDPADDAENVALATDFSWNIPSDANDYGDLAWKYEVYLSTDSAFGDVATPVTINSVAEQERLTATSAQMGGPLDADIYYWRVDCYEPNEGTVVTRTGDLWSFEAGCALPSLIGPPDTYSPDVEIDVDLQWSSDPLAITHDVVITPDGGSPVTLVNKTSPFNPYADAGITMEWEKKYTWQIKEYDAGSVLLAEGPIWKFEVRALNCVGMNSDIDGSNDCIVNLADFAMLASEWLDCNWDDGGKASPCP